MNYPEWKEKQFWQVPDCHIRTGGEGERRFFSILCTCVKKYPEHLEEFAEEFNQRKCFPPFSEREKSHKVTEAFKLAGRGDYCRAASTMRNGVKKTIHTITPRVSNKVARRASEKVGKKIDEAWLWWHSPIVPDAMNAESFLKHVFEKGDKVFIANLYNRKRPSVLLTIEEPSYTPKLAKLAKKNQKGVWYMTNPITGQWNGSGKEQSMRNKESLAAWRNYVFESDVVEESTWLAVVVAMPLPIAAIYRSGNKSIHVLIKINAKSAEEWEQYVEFLKPTLLKLGADKALMHRAQLSRLPQCFRGEEGSLQKLLYLDPNPDGKKIIEKPLRETRKAIMERMEAARAMQLLAEDAEPFPEIQLPEGGEE